MSIKPPLEKDIQKTIIQYLRMIGAYAIRMNSGAVRATYRGRERLIRFNDQPGCQDVVCCVVGRFVAIEVKRPGGKATDVQLAALDAVRKAGGVALVATSVEDVMRALTLEGLTR